MNKSESIKNIASALSKFQAQLGTASKSKANPFFKSTYADLAEIVDTIKEPLAANGLAYIQLMDSDANGDPTLTTIITHESGEFIQSSTPLVYLKKEPQAIGSAVTYFRRYALAAALGVVQDDDDGNATMSKSNTKPTNKTKKPHELLHEQDNVSFRDYIIPVGQSKGKKLLDIGPDKAKEFYDWICKQPHVNGPLETTKIKLKDYLDSISEMQG